jgi:hypothetical protein
LHDFGRGTWRKYPFASCSHPGDHPDVQKIAHALYPRVPLLRSCRVPVHSSDFSGGSDRQHLRQSRPPITTFMIPMRDLCPEDREVKTITTHGRLEVPPVFLKLLQFSFKLTDAIDTSAKRNGRRLCVQLQLRQHYPKHELLRPLSIYTPEYFCWIVLLYSNDPQIRKTASLFRTHPADLSHIHRRPLRKLPSFSPHATQPMSQRSQSPDNEEITFNFEDFINTSLSVYLRFHSNVFWLKLPQRHPWLARAGCVASSRLSTRRRRYPLVSLYALVSLTQAEHIPVLGPLLVRMCRTKHSLKVICPSTLQRRPLIPRPCDATALANSICLLTGSRFFSLAVGLVVEHNPTILHS